MAGNNLFHPSRRISLLRQISLVIFVLLTAYIGIRHQVVGGGPQGSGPLDTYCVFGGVETLWMYFTTGQFLQKTNLANFVLLAATLVLVVVTGASFCGWICPFGAVQEWLGNIGKKLFGKTFVPPASWDRPLRYLRFAVLALILYMTAITGKLWFETYDPFKILFHFNFETTTAIVILVLTIVISLISERFWCKYLCPLGAIFSVLSPTSFFKLKRQPHECIGCGLCNKVCSMGINVDHARTIADGECIKCLQCMEACPKQQALVLESGKGQPASPVSPSTKA